MTTLARDVVQRALTSVGCGAGPVAGLTWLQRRYNEIATQVRLRHLRSLGQVTIPAQITAGTITVTRGAKTITGNATAQAAWSKALIGRWIRPRTVWYEIADVQGAVITLAGDFGEDSGSALTYTIVERYVEMPEGALWLGRFFHERYRNEFLLDDVALLDRMYPDRNTVGNGPVCGAHVGFTPAGRMVVELYPYCTALEIVKFRYWTGAPTLTHDTVLSPAIDHDALFEALLIDVYRWEMGRATDVNMKGTWGNLMRSQETRWKEIKARAAAKDRDDDTASIAWESSRTVANAPRIIETAEDAVWAKTLT